MTAQDSHTNIGLLLEVSMLYGGVYEAKSGKLFND